MGGTGQDQPGEAGQEATAAKIFATISVATVAVLSATVLVQTVLSGLGIA
jgi:hypothetical protein